jgi:pSer/pThr/pTyr-binding forkhead associated (FHA) protein
MSAKITIISGPDRGREFVLQAGVTLQVGRSQATATKLTDPSVSRVHCEIEFDGDRATLVNISSNGTWVNGKSITRHELGHGASVRMGGTEFIFRHLDVEPEAESVVPLVFAPLLRSGDPEAPADESWLRMECEYLTRHLARGHVSCSYEPAHYALVLACVTSSTFPSHAILTEGFHRLVCFDARGGWSEDGLFLIERFYRHAMERLAGAVGLSLGAAAEPEDLFQILRDEPRSLLCILDAGCIPENAMCRIRALTQERHAVLLVRCN